MDDLALVTGFGLATATGLNVTVPLLVAAVLARAGAFHPAPALAFLGSDMALAVLGLAASVEVVVAKLARDRRALHALMLPLCVGAAVLLAAAADLRVLSGAALVGPLFLAALSAGGSTWPGP